MSFLAEQHERHTSAKLRLWGAPPRPQLRLPAAVLPSAAPFDFLGRPGPESIIKLVALKHRVSVDEIMGKRRALGIIAARHLAMWLVRMHCDWLSLPDIGRLFLRDHTTVISAIRKFTGEKPAIKCPCCGHSMQAPPNAEALKALPLGDSEAELLAYYIDAYPLQLASERVISRLWQLDPNGGPTAPSSGISVRVYNINKALKPYGWTIQRHGHSARRLARLK